MKVYARMTLALLAMSLGACSAGGGGSATPTLASGQVRHAQDCASGAPGPNEIGCVSTSPNGTQTWTGFGYNAPGGNMCGGPARYSKPTRGTMGACPGGGGNNYCDPDVGCITVAIQPGTPAQNAGHSCAGSPMNEYDSWFNQDKQSVEVMDMNSAWVDGQNVGWLYKGSDGKTYVQANYSSQVGTSWGINLGIVSVASSPGAYSAIVPYRGGANVPPGTQIEKCFQGGQYLGANFATG